MSQLKALAHETEINPCVSQEVSLKLGQHKRKFKRVIKKNNKTWLSLCPCPPPKVSVHLAECLTPSNNPISFTFGPQQLQHSPSTRCPGGSMGTLQHCYIIFKHCLTELAKFSVTLSAETSSELSPKPALLHCTFFYAVN